MPYPTLHEYDGVGPDPYGQAAILLVENLIHGLIAKGLITGDDAIEIVDGAAEVNADIGADLGDSVVALQASTAILRAISASLFGDLATGPGDQQRMPDDASSAAK